MKPYLRTASSLFCLDGVIVAGNRIVIPSSLRRTVLEALHAAHQGVSIMSARAADSIYWPNITMDIQRIRDECSHCHRIAKSNPMQPPSDITPPDYPFQKVCSDYFSFNNHEYVVVVDRYSNWPMVFRSEGGADGLVKRLRESFVTFGVPEELTSDGGPQFTAGKTQQFLKSWGVRHRLSSVANPHANCRAEIAVKTVKRMLMDNTSSSGSLDVDKFQKAILIYRNSIDPETKASPALVVFGRPIRDSIPVPMGRYCPHPTWKETLAHREQALAKRHAREHEKWQQHTQPLPPLQVGDHVYLQNLTGNHPRRWERTGVVVEVRQFHQYVVRVDGSGRLTIRSRQHLRKFQQFHTQSRDEAIEILMPFTRAPATADDAPEPGNAAAPTINPPIPVEVNLQVPPVVHHPVTEPPIPLSSSPPGNINPVPASQTLNCPPASPVLNIPPPAPVQKVPRAVSRLQPFNEPGVKEAAPLRQTRSRCSKN